MLSTRVRVMTLVEEEYLRTRRMLEEIYGGSLVEKRPNVNQLLALRQDGLRILHQQQIELLRDWRAAYRHGERCGSAAAVC